MAAPLLRFTRVQWLICLIAAIGFLFDTYELLMTPLVAVPAIAEFLQLPPNNPLVTAWMGKMLWMTALCGGAFGLLGGWLIDRFGRKRIMAASIFLYAFSPFAAAFSTSLAAFVFFRCTTFIGVCVEFVAAITWLAELFPDKRQRELVLGGTQAFASLGGILVTAVNVWVVNHAGSLPALPISELFNAHASWRYTLMTGLLPAIPIALLLPFVPESQVWRERRDSGKLKRPSFMELFSPQLRRVTLVTALLSACAYGAAFGALQLTPMRVAPGLPEFASQREKLVPLQDQAKALNDQLLALMPAYAQATGSIAGLGELAAQRAKARIAMRSLKRAIDAPGDDAAAKASAKEQLAKLAANFGEFDSRLAALTADQPAMKAAIIDREKILKALGDNREQQEPLDNVIKAFGNRTQFFQEIGGLLGRILLAVLVVLAVARRTLLRIFLVPGLVAFPLVYMMLYQSGSPAFEYGVMVCGLLVVAQFSYFGEYLPKVFPLHLRGTGGSFATNVGGRMIGTSAAFLTGNILAPMLSGASTYDKVAMAAAIVATSVFFIGLIASFFLPEPESNSVNEA